MRAKITSKGQITIPKRLRRKYQLRVGDVLDFDETAPVLTARRVVDPEEWRKGWAGLIAESADPWPDLSSREVLDELRGEADIPDAGTRP